MKRLKICLAYSAGGHLVQIRELAAFYKKHQYYFVTFDRYAIKGLDQKEKICCLKNPSRNIFYFVINFFQSFRIFLKEKPDVVISTGAGVALVTCFLGWIFRKKVIFIEDWCRVYKPSLSGRLIYPMAGLFIVQWEGLLKYYPKAVYRGSLV